MEGPKRKYFKDYEVNVHLGYRIDDFYRERVYVFDKEEDRFVPWILDRDLKPHRKIWIIKDIVRKSIKALNKKEIKDEPRKDNGIREES